MTPLAQRFFRQLTLPKRDRSVLDEGGVLERLEDLHCFDVGAVAGAVNQAIDQEPDKGFRNTIHTLGLSAFLPSPRTWLEYVVPENAQRTAVLVEKSADSFVFWLILDEPLTSYFCGTFRSHRALEEPYPGFSIGRPVAGTWCDDPSEIESKLTRLAIETLLLLDIINTPGLVALKTVQPHRGFERALRQLGVGRYPLQAWHEVVIKPGEPAPDDSGETGLTGRKCLHFTRAHKKRVHGQVRMISHYWSGDPALGIKRTRYRVKP